MEMETKDLNLIYLIAFMDLFAVGLTFPLLSNHLRDLGASHVTVGLLSSLYAGLQVISGPIIGSWSDIRDRKSVLIVSLAFCGFSYICLGFAQSIFIITLIRIVLGISKHSQSICKAMISDIIPPKERAAAFGRSTAFSSLGFIIGPMLAGHLSELDNGFTYICLLTGLIFFINIGLTTLITTIEKEADVPESINRNTQRSFSSEFQRSVTDLSELNWSDLKHIILLRFIFGLSLTIYFLQQPTYLREHFKLNPRRIGYTISYYSATGTVGALILPYVYDYFYKKNDSCLQRITHFFLLMTVSMIGLGLAPNIQTFLVILMPFSLSCTFLRITTMELLLKKAAEGHRGSLSATANSIVSVAKFVTPVSLGLITDKLGGQSAMLVSALAPLVGTLVAFRMTRRLKPKSR